MPILGLDHINIRTADLERTTTFFTEVLGLTVGWRPAFSFGGAWLYAGGKDLVHLVAVAKAQAPSRASSLDHFAFAIDDYEAAVRMLEIHGMAYEAAVSPEGDIRQVFVTELNGVTIELNCRAR